MSEYRSVKYFFNEAINIEQERLKEQTRLPVYQGVVQRRLTERGIEGAKQATVAAGLRLLQDDRRITMSEKTAVKVLITAMVIVVLIAIAYYFQT